MAVVGTRDGRELSLDSVVTGGGPRSHRGDSRVWVALVTELLPLRCRLMSAASRLVPGPGPPSGALLMVVAVRREARGRGGQQGAPEHRAGEEMVERGEPGEGVREPGHRDM